MDSDGMYSDGMDSDGMDSDEMDKDEMGDEMDYEGEPMVGDVGRTSAGNPTAVVGLTWAAAHLYCHCAVMEVTHRFLHYARHTPTNDPDASDQTDSKRQRGLLNECARVCVCVRVIS
eukprot:2494921-Pyramimonas_sp.AAC.1